MIEDIVRDSSSKYSNLHLDSFYPSGALLVKGGLHGNGEIRDYLSDLIDLIDKLTENYTSVVVNYLEFNTLDDSFAATIVVEDLIND